MPNNERRAMSRHDLAYEPTHEEAAAAQEELMLRATEHRLMYGPQGRNKTQEELVQRMKALEERAREAFAEACLVFE